MSAPVESKVTAATIAAALTTFVLWLLAEYVFDADVPTAVAGIVAVVVPGVVTFIAGYSAKHTRRPDLGETGRTDLV